MNAVEQECLGLAHVPSQKPPTPCLSIASDELLRAERVSVRSILGSRTVGQTIQDSHSVWYHSENQTREIYFLNIGSGNYGSPVEVRRRVCEQMV
jgi:hypothetical protein